MINFSSRLDFYFNFNLVYHKILPRTLKFSFKSSGTITVFESRNCKNLVASHSGDELIFSFVLEILNFRLEHQIVQALIDHPDIASCGILVDYQLNCLSRFKRKSVILQWITNIHIPQVISLVLCFCQDNHLEHEDDSGSPHIFWKVLIRKKY